MRLCRYSAYAVLERMARLTASIRLSRSASSPGTGGCDGAVVTGGSAAWAGLAFNPCRVFSRRFLVDADLLARRCWARQFAHRVLRPTRGCCPQSTHSGGRRGVTMATPFPQNDDKDTLRVE